MKQLSLFEQEPIRDPLNSDNAQKVVTFPKAKPRDPETASDLKEWGKLFQAKHGRKPIAKDYNRAWDDHPQFRDDEAAWNHAKRSLRKAVRPDALHPQKRQTEQR